MTASLRGVCVGTAGQPRVQDEVIGSSWDRHVGRTPSHVCEVPLVRSVDREEHGLDAGRHSAPVCAERTHVSQEASVVVNENPPISKP